MIKTGILNPQILSLLARVRHTNTLVIADRGFPLWPTIETVDISLVDGIPTVLQVLRAILPNFDCGQIWMAEEFLAENLMETRQAFKQAAGNIPIQYEPHIEFKKRVPHAIGLIRTGDTTQYANMVLMSARVDSATIALFDL
jgi:D-ribose pyranase